MAELPDVDNLSNPALSQKKIRVIAIVVIGVVVIVSVLFFLRTKENTPKPSQSLPALVSNKSEKKGSFNDTSRVRNRKIKYRLLHQQMDRAVTTEALKVLSLHGIAFNIKKNGRFFNLSVDRRYYEVAKNVLAGKGIPARGATGFELLDEDQGFGTTEYDKRIRFNRALSGELSRIVSQFHGIQDSYVQIVFPEKVMWGKDKLPVTASVLLRRISGITISDSMVFSIMKLLVNSVEGLSMKNISIVDVEGRVLSNGVFERLAKQSKQNRVLAKRVKKEVAPKVVVPKKESEPKPLVKVDNPVDDYTKWVTTWQALKQALEKEKMRKIHAVLAGVLPDNSYKVMMSIHFDRYDPKRKSNNIIIKRMTTSVVVDSDQIPILDGVLKNRVFSVISGAIGYVPKRDTIQLNLAPLHLGEGAQTMIPIQKTKPGVFLGRVRMMMEWVKKPVFVVGSGGFLVIVIAGFIVQRRRRKQRADSASVTDADDTGIIAKDKLIRLAEKQPEKLGGLIETLVNNYRMLQQ